MNKTNRRGYLASSAALATVGIAGLAGCAGDDSNGSDDTGSDDISDDGPAEFDDPIQFFLSSSEGGGLDTTSREIQQYYEEAVGTSMSFNYQPGEAIVAHNDLLGAEPDGQNMLVTNASGYAFSIIEHEVEQSDFHMIGNLISDHNLYRMHEDEDRFRTVEEMVDYARDNPGELTVSVPSIEGRNSVTSLMVQEELGIDLNHVPYDGGSEARTALAQQEVDLVNASVFNSLPWAEDTEVICVFADENVWPELTDEAPAFNDAMDANVPTDGIAARYLWLTTQEDYENNPGRVEAMQDALDEAAHNEDYRNDLAERDPPEDAKVFYLDPEETEAANDESIEIYSQAQDLIEAEYQ